jgi:hypothetical protein
MPQKLRMGRIAPWGVISPLPEQTAVTLFRAWGVLGARNDPPHRLHFRHLRPLMNLDAGSMSTPGSPPLDYLDKPALTTLAYTSTV